MADTRNSITAQYGKADRAPSAGVVSRAVHGAGKLGTGTHDLIVLAIPEYPTHRVLLLQNPAGHVHAEPFVGTPPAWVHVGARVRARVGLGPGFVIVRDVSRYQARDSLTKQALGEWTNDIGQLYRDATAAGAAPATTQLVEVSCGDSTWIPVLHKLQSPGQPDRPASKADS